MPSAIRKKSYGSVTIYSVNKEQVAQALERFTAACQQRPEVLAIVLFGSFSRGDFGVGSDVDILIILKDSPRPFLDRIPIYQPDRFPVDVDVFPYTWEEVRNGQPVAGEALATGQVLWQREEIDFCKDEPVPKGE
jgi:predicted nucleotidyltransferase